MGTLHDYHYYATTTQMPAGSAHIISLRHERPSTKLGSCHVAYWWSTSSPCTYRLTPEPSFSNIYPGKRSHWIPTARSPGVFLRVRLTHGTCSRSVPSNTPLRRSFRHTISIADLQRPVGKLCKYPSLYLPRAAGGNTVNPMSISADLLLTAPGERICKAIAVQDRSPVGR